MLNDLSAAEIQDFEDKVYETSMRPGDIVYKMGEEISGYVYLVTHGLVAMNVPCHYDIRKITQGEIIGLENVFSEHGNNITTS